MSKKTRRLLFYLSAILFFLFSYIMLLYARGFIFDFRTLRWRQTGALVGKVNVRARIFVDNRFIGNASLLNNTFDKKRLRPGIHTLTVVQKGVSSWKKKIEIKEGLVTELLSIFLIPSTLQKTALITQVTQYAHSFGGNFFAWLDQKRFMHIQNFSDKNAPIFSQNIRLSSPNQILWDSFNNAQMLVLSSHKLAWLSLGVKDIKYRVLPSNFSDTHIIFSNGIVYYQDRDQNIWSYDLYAQKHSLLVKQVDSFFIPKQSQLLYYLRGDEIYVTSLLSIEDSRLVLSLSNIATRDAEHILLVADNFFVLLKNKQGKMLLLSRQKNKWKFDYKIQSLISPDNKKIALVKNNEVHVVWQESTDVQPYRNIKEQQLIYRSSSPVHQIYWFADSEHLFVRSDSVTLFIELDTRDQTVVPLTDIMGRIIFVDYANIYTMQDGTVFQYKLYN